MLAEDLKIARRDNKARTLLREPILHHADDKPKIREKELNRSTPDSILSTSKHKWCQKHPRQLSTFNFKYNIGERLRLSGTRKTITIIERYHPGSSHHASSVNEQKIISSKKFKRPFDSPDYLVKTQNVNFSMFSKKRLRYWTPEVYVFATVSVELPPLSINKSLNNAQFSWHQTFSRRLIFPVSTHSFLWSFFFFCICTALVQDQVINFLPVGISFRLIINQFIWIRLFLTSFRAEVCEEPAAARVAGWVPTTACVRVHIRCGGSSRKRHGNRHAKPAGLRVPVRPNLRKFLVKLMMLNFGGLFRQLLHAFL